MEAASPERERAYRRRQAYRFVVWNRRHGFDRRQTVRSSPVVAVLDRSLLYLRDHPKELLAVLALVNLLSLLDLQLTTIALGRGAVEVNPFMRHFFDASPMQAALVKVGLIAAATLGIWRLRGRRSALMVALFSLAAFSALVLYEIVGLTLLV